MPFYDNLKESKIQKFLGFLLCLTIISNITLAIILWLIKLFNEAGK